MTVEVVLCCKAERAAQLHEWLTVTCGLVVPDESRTAGGVRVELALSWEQVCQIELSSVAEVKNLRLAPPFLASLYDDGADDGVYLHRKTVWTGGARITNDCSTDGSLTVRCKPRPRGVIRPDPKSMEHLRQFYRAAVNCGLEAFL